MYLECLCKIFQKYHVSFCVDKCQFLQNCVEFVGHNLTSDGNCPTQSKFELMSNWEVPKSIQSLHPYIGLVLFYSKYAPYLDMKIKPLRQLLMHTSGNQYPQWHGPLTYYYCSNTLKTKSRLHQYWRSVILQNWHYSKLIGVWKVWVAY